MDEHVGSLCPWRVVICAYCNNPHSKCHEEVSYAKIFQSINLTSMVKSQVLLCSVTTRASVHAHVHACTCSSEKCSCW